MKIRNLFRSPSLLIALGVVALGGCASPARAPLAPDAGPKVEVERTEAAIQSAEQKQYDLLAPASFERAVNYKNSAREKMQNGKDGSQVLADIAVAEHSIQEVERVGEANAPAVQGILEARRHALDANAHKLESKSFHEADEDFAALGRKMEKGDFKLDSKTTSKIEVAFGAAEVAARKTSDLREARNLITKAESDGARKKTPTVYQSAKAQMSSAEHAIELSPHSAAGYSPAVTSANTAAHKLSEVLALARQNSASEQVSLALWNQSQQLNASHAALTQANSDASAAMAKSQAEASAEQGKLENQINEKDAKLDDQSSSITALQTENHQYANTEELKQRIDEIKKTFSNDEAEVMKDGKNIVVRLKKMQFSSGRAELNANSFETLKKVDKLIAAVPASQITVEGHTDSVGSVRKNKDLSEQRAEAVKKYLVSQGLPETLNVATAGYGSEKPLKSNKTANGRATNRRVDIIIETPVVL